MATEPNVLVERRKHDPVALDLHKVGHPRALAKGTFRSLGLGLITGASDDDPAAIGTYAAAGAALGPSFLWVAPFALPMMFAVVYLSSKLGQVAGRGLFAVLRQHYSKWLLYFLLVTAVAGNIVEAGADLGGMAAALNVIVPVPVGGMVVVLGIFVLSLQIRGYKLIRSIFRWLALALLAYVGSAVLAKPDLLSLVKGTLIPTIHFNENFFAMLVAVIGTSLSAYLYSWQSNQEVEEDIALGRRRLTDRIGTTVEELSHSRRDVALGMTFASVIMYFIILSTAATLFVARKNRHQYRGRRGASTAAIGGEGCRTTVCNRSIRCGLPGGTSHDDRRRIRCLPVFRLEAWPACRTQRSEALLRDAVSVHRGRHWVELLRD